MAERAKCSGTELGHNSLEDDLLGIRILGLPDADDKPLYHVHQKNQVLICDNFLLGHCPLQEQCPRHHTPFPYHWQCRRREDHVWLSFSFSAQHHTERWYCNEEQTKAKLLDRSGNYHTLNLDTMKISGPPGCWLYDKIRRLSNSSDPACNPYFPTVWKVYWEETGTWMEYEEPIAQELVAAFERGMWNHAFYLNNRLYNVDLKMLTQCNVKTGFTRSIKYRPVFRCGTSTALHLQSVVPSLQTKVVPGEDAMDLYNGPYPATWVPPPQDDFSFTMVEMTLSEAAYQKVRKLFHATLPEDEALVLAIYRIRNDHLWQAYMRQKKLMSLARSAEDQLFLERHLFHGTGAAQVKSICTSNFNPRFAGLHAAAFGKGIYFASDASYSHWYASEAKDNMRHMFLTKVLTGYWKKGRPRLKQPPVSYDSCTNCRSDPDIFVVFKSCQCYPYFLIRYKEVNTPVIIDI
ncbi:protein mono-ADP-ribosyltransferase TIPARP-like [Elgaria multicarinata webbii]|uniref:protein mono-ADP-ribosyltransferase TIPARP-like n=1 Tax=Elgaria multicarinata webbii TaxID=159646 RepID=UPI002FCD5264